MRQLTFKDAVYDVVAKIPEGEFMTYKEVAIKIGKPGAARAVGTALSKNFNPNIPCHRVIRTDGKMGGYNRGGVDEKLVILRKEGAKL
jgi:methylated-DNA-[protein]-cysteine S-methyltransferase